MIKKLVMFTSLLLINQTIYGQEEVIIRRPYPLPMKRVDTAVIAENSTESIVIEDTGFYLVFVKRMPSLWTFWRCWKPVRIMAVYAKTSTREIWNTIDSEMPVLMTFDFREVQSLKAELLPLGCEIEIYELAFSFGSNEDAEYFRNRQAERCTQAS